MIQRIASPYKIDTNFVNQDLPAVDDDFLEILSIDTTGILYSTSIYFNNKEIILKCEIDGEEAFNFELKNIDVYGQTICFDDGKDMVTWKPCCPILFNKSIKFFAKASTTSTSREFRCSILEYTRE